ncbi:unnamed protein product [Allacma fusca]|uniref:Uncharacterized protein n=1 Tax=Allacma fusca TaxID=39272 RepID=A0A8J2JT24_9HEXA|nr:unnamed protein product [Allacma fusca]
MKKSLYIDYTIRLMSIPYPPFGVTVREYRRPTVPPLHRDNRMLLKQQTPQQHYVQNSNCSVVIERSNR